jgi:hypothetical protein
VSLGVGEGKIEILVPADYHTVFRLYDLVEVYLFLKA